LSNEIKTLKFTEPRRIVLQFDRYYVHPTGCDRTCSGRDIKKARVLALALFINHNYFFLPIR